MALRRALENCEKFFAEPLAGCLDHAVVKKLSERALSASKVYEKIKADTLAKAKAAVDVALEKLGAIAGGLPNHRDWCEGYSGNDWASFAEHAQATLLKESGVELKTREDALQQAWGLAA
eukprot:2855057-Amphidinium_carterae.3